MQVNDKVAIPVIQTIGPCNAARCNAVITAKMSYQNYLTVTNIKEDERGTVVTVAAIVKNKYAESDFMLSDLIIY